MSDHEPAQRPQPDPDPDRAGRSRTPDLFERLVGKVGLQPSGPAESGERPPVVRPRLPGVFERPGTGTDRFGGAFDPAGVLEAEEFVISAGPGRVRDGGGRHSAGLDGPPEPSGPDRAGAPPASSAPVSPGGHRQPESALTRLLHEVHDRVIAPESPGFSNIRQSTSPAAGDVRAADHADAGRTDRPSEAVARVRTATGPDGATRTTRPASAGAPAGSGAAGGAGRGSVGRNGGDSSPTFRISIGRLEVTAAGGGDDASRRSHGDRRGPAGRREPTVGLAEFLAERGGAR